MGALADAGESVPFGRAGTKCTAGGTIRDLDDEDRAALERWAAETLDPMHPRSWAWMERACSAVGIPLKAGTIRRHYTGQCACDG